jgi:hypothetical protein
MLPGVKLTVFSILFVFASCLAQDMEENEIPTQQATDFDFDHSNKKSGPQTQTQSQNGGGDQDPESGSAGTGDPPVPNENMGSASMQENLDSSILPTDAENRKKGSSDPDSNSASESDSDLESNYGIKLASSQDIRDC